MNIWLMLLACLPIVYFAYKYWHMTKDPDKRVYVPSTLEEAARRCVEMCDDQPLELNPLLLAVDAHDFCALCHHSLGQWTRNNWGLWSRDSKLYADIHERWGLDHADDLSGMILLATWHEHMGTDPSGPLQVEARRYLEHWRTLASHPAS